jgi:hypothetical protein
MLIVTLVLAVIGTVTGVASFAWQMVSFQRSGPMVKINIDYPRIGVYDKEAGKAIYTVRIKAFNAGRSPIQVTDWGVILPNDKSLNAYPGDYVSDFLGNTKVSKFSDSIPFRLKPGHCGMWFLTMDDIRRIRDEYRVKKLTAFVSLADGTTLKTQIN